MENIHINQKTAIRLGLNVKEACVLDYLIKRSDFCDWFSLLIMVNEMPFVSDKKDTMYRIVKSLEKKGVISLRKPRLYEYTFTLTFNGGW